MKTCAYCSGNLSSFALFCSSCGEMAPPRFNRPREEDPTAVELPQASPLVPAAVPAALGPPVPARLPSPYIRYREPRRLRPRLRFRTVLLLLLLLFVALLLLGHSYVG